MDKNKGKEEDEMLDTDHGENLNTQRMRNEGQENNMDNHNVCQGAIGNDSIKVFCEVIIKMAKEIGDLKTDLNMIKKETMGERPLFENVKELMVLLTRLKLLRQWLVKLWKWKRR